MGKTPESNSSEESVFPIAFFCPENICEDTGIPVMAKSFTDAFNKIARENRIPKCEHGTMRTARITQTGNN
jgi:hypothetical protein